MRILLLVLARINSITRQINIHTFKHVESGWSFSISTSLVFFQVDKTFPGVSKKT